MIGYYINLDEREDRKQHFEQLKSQYDFFSNIERLSAIKNSHGGIGCGLSHIIALNKLKERAIKNNLEFVCVLEDDFCILNNNAFINFIDEFNNIQNSKKWDIITLTPRGITDHSSKINNFKRIKKTQTTTGYIIKTAFIDTLLDNMKIAVKNLMYGNKYHIYSIDQYWKILQETNNFYYFHEIFAGQLPGYSSIEKMNVNYNHRFLVQNNY
jgi:GR25 family glycosyltransferase involved in LPS biosynthesis